MTGANSRRGAVIGLVGALVVIVAVLLANGGYAYRSQCPQASGSVETSWSYQISSVVPYLRYSRSGCAVHSATRVGLAKLGIWKISDGHGATGTVDHTSEWTDLQLAKGRARCIGNGSSYAFCSCVITELAKRFTPDEATQVSTAKRLDQLPAGLARRARLATAAIDDECR